MEVPSMPRKVTTRLDLRPRRSQGPKQKSEEDQIGAETDRTIMSDLSGQPDLGFDKGREEPDQGQTGPTEPMRSPRKLTSTPKKLTSMHRRNA
uniref:Uncharacterized protein n=1 Tax=Fagus sylvatica TaxID=28930 RepID=A0A2N9J8J1_FAGSY